jgi:tetratricopeptide (TPR) repeat protein
MQSDPVFFKFMKVILVFLVFIAATPSFSATSAEYYQAGLKLYSAQNYAQAVQYFGAAIQLDPNNAAALQGRANCYYAQGQYQNALADYQKVLSLNPSNTQLAGFIEQVKAKAGNASGGTLPASNSAYDQGVALYGQKQYAGAVVSFQQAVQQNPKDPKAYYYLGLSQLMTGDKKNATLSLALSNRLGPNPSVEAYVNSLKSGLSTDDRQWVDRQMSFSTASSSVGGRLSSPPKTFGVRFQPAIAMFNLSDFQDNASGLQEAASMYQITTDPTTTDTGSVPVGSANVRIEPVMSLGDNLEIGLPLAFFPVGTATDTIIGTSSGLNYTDSYSISAFSVGLNARYFFMKGEIRPFVGGGALVMPISIDYKFSETSSGFSASANGSFSALAIGAQIQGGADWYLDKTFVISPFVGYQIASADPFKGTFSSTSFGTTTSYTGQLEMEPYSNGYLIYADSDSYTPPSGSRPLKVDLGGIMAGIQLSAFF